MLRWSCRDRPTTRYQINLQRSPIASIITRFAGNHQSFGFRWEQGNGILEPTDTTAATARMRQPATPETEARLQNRAIGGPFARLQEISARAWLGVAITALSRRPFPLFVTHLISIRQCSSRAFNFAVNI